MFQLGAHRIAFASALNVATLSLRLTRPRLTLPWQGGSGHRRVARRTWVVTRACASSTDAPKFELVREKVLFRRYQTVYQRDVRYPDGREVSFDVLGNERSDFKSVFVFPFDEVRATATLVREYAPGHNGETLGVVAGMFERDKHDSIEAAARAELREEARLAGGRLVPLARRLPADKYSRNEMFYFLALGCTQDVGPPAARDAEEWISVVPGLSLRRVGELVRDGQLNAPNAVCALLAIDKLRTMGFS